MIDLTSRCPTRSPRFVVVGGEKGLIGYLERLAVENSSAYAGLLAKILPHQLAMDAGSDGGPTQITFKRIIVHPGGREEIGVTPKLLPSPASHMLPSPKHPTDDTNEGPV